MIVKGLLVLLEKIFSGKPVDEILSVSSADILNSVGLDGAVTSQRTNGFSSAVEKIQGIVK
jgi:cysteine desulfuration protein SufE